jgi:hypothetical protein
MIPSLGALVYHFTMARLYLSSTYEDLAQFRGKAASVLRQMGHQVIGMEDYAASDIRPLAKCLADVRSAELYVGLFAWRYGFVPPEGPGKSITELEYREALAKPIPTLIFVLSDDTPWLPRFLDPGAPLDAASPVVALRADLMKAHTVGRFSSPDNLASAVAAAVSLQVASAGTQERQKLFVTLAHTGRFQPQTSFSPDLSQGIEQARNASILEIDFGVTPWWVTRLLLVTLLVRDYTKISAVVFLDNKRFVGVAEVKALDLALTRLYPAVEDAYAQARRNARAHARINLGIEPDSKSIINFVLTSTIATLQGLAPGGEEANAVKVDQQRLTDLLGAALTTDQIESSKGAADPLDLFEIISKTSPFVAAVSNGQLDRVIDRAQLASQVAASLLREQLKSKD